MREIDIKEIFKILPHRYPFLLVDRVLDYDLEAMTIVGRKNVTVNEPFFNGHFPDAPIMPGVLILEALAQTGGIIANLLGKDQGRIAVLLKINDAKFRTPVRPGDVLDLKCHVMHATVKSGRMEAKAFVGERLAASATIYFAFVSKSEL
ncbi:3-hydroxyacyl-ACP dehydratase FabZ [Chlamydiales bacterium]|nr:3-hydroxyacyl-ACP dehydratase FabZ [Chlamydiales bacterium]